MSAAHASGRLPRIVGIGAQKAGTTWLFEMLIQNPGVWSIPMKEIHFFNHHAIPEHRAWAIPHVRNQAVALRDRLEADHREPTERERHLLDIGLAPDIMSPDWYRRIFAPAPIDSSPLDVTPAYSILPEEGIAAMTRWLADARFILLIRDPVRRALSQLRMNAKRGFTGLSQNDPGMMVAAQRPGIAERSDYARYLPLWQKYAGDRLLILPYGRIARDPAGLLAEIEAFCGLPRFEYQGQQTRINEGETGIRVPREVEDDLERRFCGQRDFLRLTLGDKFVADIG